MMTMLLPTSSSSLSTSSTSLYFIYRLFSFLLLLTSTCCNAFSVLPRTNNNNMIMMNGYHIRRQQQQRSLPYIRRQMSDQPSDSTSDDDEYPGYGSATTTTSRKTEDYADNTSSSSDVLVSNVLDLLPSSNNDISSETRSAINELLYKLESLNPNRDNTAINPLLNGVWELRYFGNYANEGALPSPTRQLALFLYSGGYSPGLFLLQAFNNKGSNPFVELGELEIAISRVQPRIEATIPVQMKGPLGSILTSGSGSSSSSIKVTATLDVLSNMRIKETYETINFFSTTNIQIPKLLQYSRELYITYVDNDLLIIRDASGIPEVLVRKNKTFLNNWGTDPKDIDDITPPGMTSTNEGNNSISPDDDNDEASY